MKMNPMIAAVALGLMGVAGTVSAQPYGGRDYGYGDRDYRSRDYDRGGRDYDRGGRDDYDDRRGRGRGDYAFDEREYLRCNPDVRRAIAAGQMTSGAAHYKTFGRREGRPLSC